MNRVMRICLLNWNSHLLPPRLRPALFTLLSSFIALSFILVSSFHFPVFNQTLLHLLCMFCSLLIPLFSLLFHICHFQVLLMIHL